MWQIALSEMKGNPFFGGGTVGFKKSWELRKKTPSPSSDDDPHDSYPNTQVGYGNAGLLTIIWLLFSTLKQGWRGRNAPLGSSLLAVNVIITIGSFTDVQILQFTTAVALTLFARMSGASNAE